VPRRLSLDEIGLRHGTDKASSNHNYLEFYEIFLAPMRDDSLTILEVGVLNGASLRMWEEYFPQARIVGADILPDLKRFERGRILIEQMDQSNIEQLTAVASKHGPFDIIIEDGSHMWEHQTTSLRTLFPFVKNNGLYIVEDLHTNYGPMEANYRGVASTSCVEFLKQWADLRVACGQIEIEKTEDAFLRTYGRAVQFMTFYARACLIKKRLPHKYNVVNVGRALVEPVGGNRVAVSILAHLSYVGDVLGQEGFVNLASERFAFQGIAIETAQNLVECRVQSADGVWSEWVDGNRFAGKRGESKLITGVSIRLCGAEKAHHDLTFFCRFKGSEGPVICQNGEACVSPSGGPLCGLQVQLSRRVD
jgi:hypothetical protein